MDSGQDGNGFAGTNGFGQFGGANVSGNLNNSQVQTPQGVISSGNNVVAGGSGVAPAQPMIKSDGGDIVLSSGGQKSGRGLKWGIGIIVGILILAGIGVGVWFGISGVETQQIDETEFTDRQKELLKFFDVSEALSKYDGDILQVYVDGGSAEMKKEIASKLAELDKGVIGYVDDYIEKMSDFSRLAGEVIEIFYENGCAGKTVEDLDSCVFAEEVGNSIDEKIIQMRQIQNDVKYTIKAARRFYENGGR